MSSGHFYSLCRKLYSSSLTISPILDDKIKNFYILRMYLPHQHTTEYSPFLDKITRIIAYFIWLFLILDLVDLLNLSIFSFMLLFSIISLFTLVLFEETVYWDKPTKRDASCHHCQFNSHISWTAWTSPLTLFLLFLLYMAKCEPLDPLEACWVSAKSVQLFAMVAMFHSFMRREG